MRQAHMDFETMRTGERRQMIPNYLILDDQGDCHRTTGELLRPADLQDDQTVWYDDPS